MSYFRRFIYEFFKPDYEPNDLESYADHLDIESQYEALKAAYEAGWKAAMNNKEQ